MPSIGDPWYYILYFTNDHVSLKGGGGGFCLSVKCSLSDYKECWVWLKYTQQRFDLLSAPNEYDT